MTAEEIDWADRIRASHDVLTALAEAATPGPWEARPYRGGGARIIHRVPGQPFICVVNCVYSDEDAAFIAACDPKTVLALIATIAALRTRYEPTAEQMAAMEERLNAWLADVTEDPFEAAVGRVRQVLDDPDYHREACGIHPPSHCTCILRYVARALDGDVTP